MKKLVNDPKDVVVEMIDGVVMANPQLKKLGDFNVIVRSDCRDELVKSLAIYSTNTHYFH